ncbi:MAG: DUF3568 family protein [Candidatus Omnitrophota bacterium]
MFRKFILGVWGIVLLINVTGCAAVIGTVVGGAGTALWQSGKLSDEVNVSYNKAVQAVTMALKSLDMEITKETQTDKITQIKSNYADGRVVWINIIPINESTTRIEVRVGISGDKSESGKILEKIKKYL